MKTLAIAMALVCAFALAGVAQAAPDGPNFDNPNVVAYYPTGPHGIPGDYHYHEGMDVVMRNGNSGNFDQWFYGQSSAPGEGLIGHHSVWKIMKKNDKCNDVLVPNASALWGDYLVAGADYCVKTNDFLIK